MKAKIKQIRENVRHYDGKSGTIYIHAITVEGDAQEYEYHCAKPECEKFAVGVEAEFTTETKVNGQYTNHKIIPVNKPFIPKFQGASTKDQGTIAALSSVSSAVNFYQQRNGTEKDVMDFAEKIFTWATSKSTSK